MRVIASSEGGARPGRTGNEREGVGAEKEKREGRENCRNLAFFLPIYLWFSSTRAAVGRSPLSARLWWVAWWLNP